MALRMVYQGCNQRRNGRMHSGKMIGFFALALVAALSACDAKRPKTANAVAIAAAADWRQVVTATDMDRLREWRSAFVGALEKAKTGGNAESILREGALLEPDAALGGPNPAPGDYQCRVIKLGANGARVANYVVYPAYPCRIVREGNVSSFSKSGGMQRPIGLIFDNDDKKQIFLGTMMLGDETAMIDYGRDATRDLAGAVERIGDKRWRIILPYPHFESVMDVIEMVPAG
jgi:Domain of unknown function (DUF4893)